MPKKNVSKISVNPVVRFFMAEEFRQELNGKVTAIGLYTDSTLTLQLPVGVPEPSEAEPLAIKSLGFLFNVSGLAGNTEISIDLISNGQRKPFLTQKSYESQASSINLIGQMEPCFISSFGAKTFVVKLGGLEHNFSYELIRNNLPEQISENSGVAVVANRKPAPKRLKG